MIPTASRDDSGGMADGKNAMPRVFEACRTPVDRVCVLLGGAKRAAAAINCARSYIYFLRNEQDGRWPEHFIAPVALALRKAGYPDLPDGFLHRGGAVARPRFDAASVEGAGDEA